MKTTLVIVFLLLGSSSYTQDKFEWTVAAQGVSLTYVDVAADTEGNVLSLAERGTFSYQTQEAKMMYGDGTAIGNRELIYNSNASVLMYYNKNGKLVWSKVMRNDMAEFRQIAFDEFGNVYVIAFVDYWDEDDEGNEFGHLPAFDDEPVAPGYKLVKLSKTGMVLEVNDIKGFDYEADIEIISMAYYGSGKFVVGGELDDGPLIVGEPLPVNKGGGQFVVMLDKTGEILWSDVVLNRKSSCCSSFTEGYEISVSSEGMIYMTGTFMEGGIFSNGDQVIAPLTYSPNKNDKSYEAYVTAYNEDGELEWKQTVGSKSRSQGIVASKEGVYVTHVNYGNKSFGKNIDTTGRVSIVLSFLTADGKMRYNKGLPVTTVTDMNINPEDQLIVAGTYKELYGKDKQSRKLGEFPLDERDETVVVTFNKKGEVIRLWSADLFTTRERLRIATNNQNETFIVLEAHCAMSLGLQLIDKGLPPLNCYGGVPILGKIKY
jgi:hypothetical protein